VTSEETAESDEQWVEAAPVTRTTSSRIDQPQTQPEIRSAAGHRQLPSAD
jgi:hypothetical protein